MEAITIPQVPQNRGRSPWKDSRGSSGRSKDALYLLQHREERVARPSSPTGSF